MISAQDMADAFNGVGIDTAEKVGAVLGYLLSIVTATRAQAGVEEAIAQKDASAAAALLDVDNAQKAADAAAAAEQSALQALVTLFG